MSDSDCLAQMAVAIEAIIHAILETVSFAFTIINDVGAMADEHDKEEATALS